MSQQTLALHVVLRFIPTLHWLSGYRQRGVRALPGWGDWVFPLWSGGHSTRDRPSLLGPDLELLERTCLDGLSVSDSLWWVVVPVPLQGLRLMLWSLLQLKEWVQKLMVTLRHPSLPLLELQEIMTSVSGRIPASVEKSVRRVMAQYASNITSVLCQFPSQQVCAPHLAPSGRWHQARWLLRNSAPIQSEQI